MTSNLEEIGRLSMRVEGDKWAAYYRLGDRSLRLAEIHMACVERLDRKEAFMELMRDVVADIIEGATGVRPVWPDPPQPAPESERSGSA